jgi:hypothetical protein
MWVTAGNIHVVNRGSAFWVYGKRDHIHFRNIRITGNRVAYANMNGDGTWFPATEDKCFDVWDITNKGIHFEADIPHDHSSLENIRIDHWSGELFYFGYGDTRRPGGLITITDSEFDHGTSDGVSMSTALTAKRNNFHDLGANGIENSSYAEQQIIQYNTVTDSTRGISIANFPVGQKGGTFDISNNVLKNISKTGIMIGAQNVHIHGNTLTDFSYQKNGLWTGIAVINNTKGYCPSNPELCKAKNIEIDHNTLKADQRSSGTAIVAVAGDYLSADNINIHDNVAGLTPFAASHGISLDGGVVIVGQIKDLQEYRNIASGATYRSTDNMLANNVKIGKDPTTVVKFRPIRLRDFTIQATATVLSTARVIAMLTWFDASGVQKSRPLLAASAYDAGTYTIPQFSITAQGATETQYIKLVVTTDKPGSVLMSAKILEGNNTHLSPVVDSSKTVHRGGEAK